MATTATGSGHSISYIAESTYGTTPATPAFSDLRHTGTSLALTKNTYESAEIRSDRQVTHFRHGTKSVSGDINIELSYGTFDDWLEATLCGTWTTNVLKAGVTRRSFTIERLFSNLDTPEYHRYTGCEANAFNLSVTPESVVTGSFGVIGQGTSIATTIITGATYGAATTTDPLDSFTGTISEGGSTIGIVTSLEFSLENGLNPLFVVGSDETLRPSIGRSMLTGSMSVYFQSATLLNKFINETASTLEFTLTDAAGNDYIFEFPNIKYNGGQPDVEGEGEVTLSMPFIALYDATEASNIVITRTPA